MRWRGRVGFPRAAGRVEPEARWALLRARAAIAVRHASTGADSDAGVSGLLALVARAESSAAGLVRVEKAVLHGDVSYTRPSPLVSGRWNQAQIARTLAQALGDPGAVHGGGQYLKWVLWGEARPVPV